jgi:UDP-2,3-diacylglucosamine hydrolase
MGPDARRFCSFLAQFPARGDFLVLGGDIFDLFVGNKPAMQRKFADVLSSVRGCAERGVEVHYLEGNHDFHLSGVFGHQEKLHFHADDFELVAGGNRIWISHGDLIDHEDHGYRFLRAATRSLPFRVFLWAVPGQAVEAIGSWSSRQSRKYHDSEKIDKAGQGRLRALYLEFARAKIRAGFHHVLVGHSHLRDQIAVSEGKLSGEYVNLGFSSDLLPFAVLEAGPGRSFELKSFK